MVALQIIMARISPTTVKMLKEKKKKKKKVELILFVTI
jgi:hypothetical protein